MEIMEIQMVIEAILFAAGDPVPLDKIAQIIEVDKNTTRSILLNMMDEWDRKARGIQIREVDGSFFLCTRPLYYEFVSKLFEIRQKQGLSQACMEVLSIIAYNQPITRAEIERIRGVTSDSAVNRLLERNLIRDAGRLDTPGKPVVFETTEEFLKAYGFKNLDELPRARFMNMEI